MSDFNLIPLLPELFLAMAIMGLLIVGVNGGNRTTSIISWASVAAMGIAALLLVGLDWSRITVLNNMFVFDQFAGFLKLLILAGLMACLAMSLKYLKQEDIYRFEYPVLVVLSGIGMMLLVSSNNFLSLYMALELQSLALYVLAAFQRNVLRSSESGVKYFILGALSSGFILFGISLVYGFSGSLDFDVIGTTLASLESAPIGVVVGLVFILAGIAFKVSAAPFHMWTPDVYQGAPTAVTALFAIVPKVAALGLLIRLLFEPFAALSDEWFQIIYFIAVLSMVLAAFAGLAQDNLKRLLAYSSIGNMGYALIGVLAGSQAGIGAVILYMLIYMVMTAGVFTIVLAMRRDGLEVNKISDLAGLSKNAPFMAYALAIFMFSMAGIPPMAGFFGKLVIFEAAVAQELYILAVLGVLASVVAAYYYIKIIKVMFFDEAAEPFDKGFPLPRKVIVYVSLAFVLCFIFRPAFFISATQGAASVFFTG